MSETQSRQQPLKSRLKKIFDQQVTWLSSPVFRNHQQKMFWPSPVDSACDVDVLDTPRYFAVDDSKYTMVFLHCEEAEDEMCACPATANIHLALASLDTPATGTAAASDSVLRTRCCDSKVNVDLSYAAMWHHSDPR